ncbi:putative DNA replication complex GINS protein SLD5 [Apostichopus japonicus]|uniref:DNA replication complex GINS protein SLD5 n=1 Tax=Stichopus japonicus TaxID=307972 RepID=A0A2G8L8J8_STIJA|nr:putative DNA replication complex GINS protein SLD5 [Apostichopus japonicus]
MSTPDESYEEQDEDSEEEEVEMTAAEALAKLEEAWLNEKFAPDLLESKSDLVDCMLEQINQMEENLRKCKKGDMRILIHRMEIDRIRFIISSYLRRRLEKIEMFHQEILHRDSLRKEDDPLLLSEEELRFAKDYADGVQSHFKSLVLTHLPQNFQKLDREKTAPKPDVDSYVFLKANRDQDQVLIEPELDDDPSAEVVDLVKDSQYIMRFRPLAPLVADGTVSLI